MLDTVIRGATIVSSAESYVADIGILDGKIAAVSDTRIMPPATQVIDATGKYVLPGFIDPHLHFACHSHHLEPLPAALQAAAYGGITTVLAMLVPGVATPMRPLELIEEFRALAQSEAVVDFGFHVHLAEQDGVLEDIPTAVAEGCPSFKIFLAYKSIGRMASDAHLLNAMEKVAEAGGILLVHAEDGELIDRRIAQQVARGRVSPMDFLHVHPPEVEYIAVEKVLGMARLTECPLAILHISTARGVDLVHEAKANGQRVWLETCPQYLELTNDLLQSIGPNAKVSPPLRTKAENEGLWSRLLKGQIDFIGSDHSPQVPAMKRAGYQNIFDCPYGMPGVETMVMVMQDGIQTRGGSLSDLVRWCAEGPAKAYGLYPRKGSIQIGADADLVIWDTESDVTLRNEEQHTLASYTPYHGRTVTGRPVTTLLRGQVLLDDGVLRLSPGGGQFLPRLRYA